mmetsp:Transcript_31033/g.26132  ORF Transcript_31033/g.26132 Transcript_31033/m.26132 type:complete len:99 (-) Transcript_31033:395-691(-)
MCKRVLFELWCACPQMTERGCMLVCLHLCMCVCSLHVRTQNLTHNLFPSTNPSFSSVPPALLSISLAKNVKIESIGFSPLSSGHPSLSLFLLALSPTC